MKSFQVAEFNAPLQEVDHATPQPTGTQVLLKVKAVSDRVAVMYLGRMCEVGPSEQLFAKPAHPYTALLIEAIPVPDPDVRPAETVPVGEPPSPISPPSGCRFRTRCPRADQQCSDEVPELRNVTPRQFVACHHPLI